MPNLDSNYQFKLNIPESLFYIYAVMMYKT